MNTQRFDPSKFAVNSAKPLPVLLMLDVSGSMNEVVGGSFKQTGRTVVEDGRTWNVVEGGTTRIEVLNQAVQDMISSFAGEEKLGNEFLVSVITFGQDVRVHMNPAKASSVEWQPLTASGQTPLGRAIRLAKRLIEDKETTPSRAYRPVVVLASDGKPTDEWRGAMQEFVETGRSTKCDRIAIAIGDKADEVMLQEFIAGTPNPLFHAHDAQQIKDVFEKVTMSVTVRNRSQDPNKVIGMKEDGAAPTAGEQGTSEDGDDGFW